MTAADRARTGAPRRGSLHQATRQVVGVLLLATFVGQILIHLATLAPVSGEKASLLVDLQTNLCSQFLPGPGKSPGQREQDNARGCCVLCHLPGVASPDTAFHRLAETIVWTRLRPALPDDQTSAGDQTDIRTPSTRAPPFPFA